MLLFLKITLVPAIIALVSIAGRIWGARLSGFLAGLPVIVGPILVFLTFDHGEIFAADSAEAALAGVASLGLFCTAYAVSSLRYNIFTCLCAGWGGFAIATYFFTKVDLPLVSTLCLVILALLIYLRIFPHTNNIAAGSPTSFRQILIRMLASACLVLTITIFSDLFGARLSGLLAPFPIAGTVLSSFTHHYNGAEAARRLLDGFIRGLFGMAAFCFVVTLILPTHGIWMSLILATPLAALISRIGLQINPPAGPIISRKMCLLR